MSPSSKAGRPVKVIKADPKTRASDTPTSTMRMKPTTDSESAGQDAHTPLNSPVPGEREPTITMTVVQFVQAVQAALRDASPTTSGPIDVESQRPTDAEKPRSRASSLSYVSVKEVWDKTTFEYKITKTPAVEEIDDYEQYLFVVRTRIDKSTTKPIKYIDVKSLCIRDVLAHVLADVRGVSLKEDKPSIEQNLLFYFLIEIKKYRKTTIEKASEKEAVLKHLDVLLDFLDGEYQVLESRLQSLLKNDEITYDLLWTIFKPNTDVFTLCKGTGVPRCMRCNFGEERRRTDGTRYFHLELRYLDFDGENLGEATTALAIEEFRGAKKINLLSSFPLTYHQQSHKLKEQLIDYGRKFVSLIGVHHRAYEGKAFYFDKEGKIVTRTIDESRIMVDPLFFYRRNPNYRKMKIEPQSELSFTSWLLNDDKGDSSGDGRQLKTLEKDPQALKASELLICNSTVYGYSLKEKSWLEFAVAHISDIIWDQSSFQNLAIPDIRKKALQALCEAHGRESDIAFEDFVAGKGRGLIILLHGPPGVGKTLTAETISEHLRKPFYSVSAGDLGTTPTSLEQNLSEIFDLSSHWKALLLLDEADVFAETRSTSDLHRNALVSVFLRMLEYYGGIMFLTTNRVQMIDDAFASRVHVPLRYNELTKEARKQVWIGQLHKSMTPHGAPVCSPADVDDLAKHRLNGREITNVTSTAQAMAAFDRTVVKMRYLEDAIELNQQFQVDFKGAGHFENQRAYT